MPAPSKPSPEAPTSAVKAARTEVESTPTPTTALKPHDEPAATSIPQPVIVKTDPPAAAPPRKPKPVKKAREEEEDEEEDEDEDFDDEDDLDDEEEDEQEDKEAGGAGDRAKTSSTPEPDVFIVNKILDRKKVGRVSFITPYALPVCLNVFLV